MAELKNTIVNGVLNVNGDLIASKIIKRGGTADQVLCADGSVTTLSGLGAGTVTSVGVSVPTGLSVSGSPITSAGTIAITYASGYSIPTTEKQGNWDTAYGWGNHANAGYADWNQVLGYGFILGAGIVENEIIVGAANGEITSSGKQLTTTLGADHTTVPTSKAVADAIPSLADYVKGPASSTNTAIAIFDGTSGKIIKESGATIDANRNLKFNGPGNISWEDGTYHQRIKITDDSTVNSAVFTFQQTEDSGTNWNDLFTVQDRGTIIAKNPAGGALSLTLDRGNNANWRWLSDNGNFIAQCDYTSAKVSYFNVLTMAYNTGNVSVDKGTLTSTGGFIHGNLTAASGKTKNDYILLAGGGTKALADFGLSNNTSFNPSDYQPKDDDLTAIAGLTGTSGFLKKTAANTWTLDTTTYITFSGSYNDLTNKPTIPAAQIQSDWNQTSISALDYIKNKPTIPTIPSNNITGSGATSYLAVFDGTYTIADSAVTHDSGKLNAVGYKINSKATWQYNSSTDCIELVW